MREPLEVLEELVEWIGEGKTLRSFSRIKGNPSYVTLYSWIKANPAIAERIACARECGYDAISEECVEIIDSAYDANLGKAQVWTRLQLLAKWNPKKYGDKITHQGDESQPLVVRHIGKPSE
jgi:hypothetical protein